MKHRPEGSIHQFGMLLMVSSKLGNAFGPVFRIVAHSDCAACELFSLIRQCVCLKIVDHLQFVLDVAQKQIGGGERIPLLD